MKKIKLGILGLGRAGYNMHLPELKGKEDMYEISAVCDIKADRCENMKNLYGCNTYQDVEEFVEDPEIDIVDVATRSCDHFKHAKTALDAGKIVFLEKPVCIDMEETQMLKALLEQYGDDRLYVRHNRRFEAKFMQVQSIIDSGILGDVYYIKRSAANYDRRRDWQTLMQYGGGQLLNWAPILWTRRCSSAEETISGCSQSCDKLPQQVIVRIMSALPLKALIIAKLSLRSAAEQR